MRSATAILCAMTMLATWGLAQTSQPDSVSPKTGEFSITFTQRSPLSSDEELARRLPDKQHPLKADYKIDSMPFRVYVPKDYDASQPCGLLVFLCYKATGDAAPSLQPLLDQHHLIFAVSQNLPDSAGTAIGTSLDAVYNLSKQYHIDPKRVWVLGEQPAEDLAFGFPDVFTAGIYRNYEYFRPIKSHQPNAGFYPAGLPRPPAQYLDKAKSHPQVILTWPAADMDEFKKLLPDALKADGFKYVMTIEVGIEPYHYPNFQLAWFEKVVDFIDAPGAQMASQQVPETSGASAAENESPAPPPASENGSASQPTSQPQTAGVAPAAEDPTKLLNLAKNYIASHAYGPARKRLNLIITKFPNDPAAAEAHKLLDSLPPQ